MKIWELASGIRIPLMMEEYTLIDKLLKKSDLPLSERQKVIAQNLVKKGILIKEESDNELDECIFRINYRVDVWRD